MADAAGVDAGEVGERGQAKHRIALGDAKRHPAQGDEGRRERARDGQRDEQAAAAPMEIVAFAQTVPAPAAQAGAGIEQAVAHVDDPHDQDLQHQHPERQAHTDDPGEGERPDGRDRRGVEAGQMPAAQHSDEKRRRGHGERRDRAESGWLGSGGSQRFARARIGNSQRHLMSIVGEKREGCFMAGHFIRAIA